MASSSKPTTVEMVRIEDETEKEATYDVEKELGRDVSSVFGGASGSGRFVTASELERLREEREGRGDEEAAENNNNKPLWEVLREQKEKKEREFGEGWKTMKEGKNRPLEEDEAAFLDEVEEQKREGEKRKRKEEEELAKQFKLEKQEAVKMKNEKAKDSSNINEKGGGVVGDAGNKNDTDFAASKSTKKSRLVVKKKTVVVKSKSLPVPPPQLAKSSGIKNLIGYDDDTSSDDENR